MSSLIALYNAHPVLVSLAGYYVVSAFIGALPSPTSTSSQLYLFFFKFLNTLGGNLLRAWSTTLEKSPNWQDAHEKAKVAENGGQVPKPN